MRRYETIFIADPDLPQDARENLFERARTLVSSNGGDLVDFDEWGNRRLAYEVKKKLRGHYVRLDYCGDGAVVSALENAFRIDERVMKFLTVLQEQEADPEALKAELAAKKAADAESTGDHAVETATVNRTEAEKSPPADAPEAEKAAEPPPEDAEERPEIPSERTEEDH